MGEQALKILGQGLPGVAQPIADMYSQRYALDQQAKQKAEDRAYAKQLQQEADAKAEKDKADSIARQNAAVALQRFETERGKFKGTPQEWQATYQPVIDAYNQVISAPVGTAHDLYSKIVDLAGTPAQPGTPAGPAPATPGGNFKPMPGFGKAPMAQGQVAGVQTPATPGTPAKPGFQGLLSQLSIRNTQDQQAEEQSAKDKEELKFAIQLASQDDPEFARKLSGLYLAGNKLAIQDALGEVRQKGYGLGDPKIFNTVLRGADDGQAAKAAEYGIAQGMFVKGEDGNLTINPEKSNPYNLTPEDAKYAQSLIAKRDLGTARSDAEKLIATLPQDQQTAVLQRVQGAASAGEINGILKTVNLQLPQFGFANAKNFAEGIDSPSTASDAALAARDKGWVERDESGNLVYTTDAPAWLVNGNYLPQIERGLKNAQTQKTLDIRKGITDLYADPNYLKLQEAANNPNNPSQAEDQAILARVEELTTRAQGSLSDESLGLDTVLDTASELTAMKGYLAANADTRKVADGWDEKLRSALADNNLDPATQDTINQALNSFDPYVKKKAFDALPNAIRRASNVEGFLKQAVQAGVPITPELQAKAANDPLGAMNDLALMVQQKGDDSLTADYLKTIFDKDTITRLNSVKTGDGTYIEQQLGLLTNTSTRGAAIKNLQQYMGGDNYKLVQNQRVAEFQKDQLVKQFGVDQTLVNFFGDAAQQGTKALQDAVNANTAITPEMKKMVLGHLGGIASEADFQKTADHTQALNQWVANGNTAAIAKYGANGDPGNALGLTADSYNVAMQTASRNRLTNALKADLELQQTQLGLDKIPLDKQQLAYDKDKLAYDTADLAAKKQWQPLLVQQEVLGAVNDLAKAGLPPTIIDDKTGQARPLDPNNPREKAVLDAYNRQKSYYDVLRGNEVQKPNYDKFTVIAQNPIAAGNPNRAKAVDSMTSYLRAAGFSDEATKAAVAGVVKAWDDKLSGDAFKKKMDLLDYQLNLDRFNQGKIEWQERLNQIKEGKNPLNNASMNNLQNDVEQARQRANNRRNAYIQQYGNVDILSGNWDGTWKTNAPQSAIDYVASGYDSQMRAMDDYSALLGQWSSYMVQNKGWQPPQTSTGGVLGWSDFRERSAAIFNADTTPQPKPTPGNPQPGATPAPVTPSQDRPAATFTPAMQAIAPGVQRVANNLGIDPNDLMAVIAFETAGTFSPSVRNPNSSAVGLFQMTDVAAKGMGYASADAWYKANPTADKQLVSFEKYLKNAGIKPGMTLEDIYAAVAAPASVGADPNKVVYPAGSPQAKANPSWAGKDGTVQKSEIAGAIVNSGHLKNYFPAATNPDKVLAPPVGDALRAWATKPVNTKTWAAYKSLLAKGDIAGAQALEDSFPDSIKGEVRTYKADYIKRQNAATKAGQKPAQPAATTAPAGTGKLSTWLRNPGNSARLNRIPSMTTDAADNEIEAIAKLVGVTPQEVYQIVSGGR